MNVTLIVIFLAFTSVTLVTNTLMIWFAYKGFANLTTRFTGAAREFQASSETREWLVSLDIASQQAVRATEVTKQKLAELDPQFENLQARYGFMLAKIDTKVEKVADSISDNAQRVSNAVIDPANKFSAFTSGIQRVVGFVAPTSDDE